MHHSIAASQPSFRATEAFRSHGEMGGRSGTLPARAINVLDRTPALKTCSCVRRLSPILYPSHMSQDALRVMTSLATDIRRLVNPSFFSHCQSISARTSDTSFSNFPRGRSNLARFKRSGNRGGAAGSGGGTFFPSSSHLRMSFLVPACRSVTRPSCRLPCRLHSSPGRWVSIAGDWTNFRPLRVTKGYRRLKD